MSEQEVKKEEVVEEPAAESQEAVEENLEAGEEDLAAQLQEVSEKLREQEDKVLRMAAELDNFKKRMQRERQNLLKYAEEDLLTELLPNVDNLERAIEQGRSTDDVTSLLEGVEMTFKGIINTLEKFGVSPIDGVGEPFDPNFHEALAMENSDEFAANVIMQEYQKGYMYKDRLIRAAKVVVSKGKGEE